MISNFEFVEVDEVIIYRLMLDLVFCSNLNLLELSAIQLIVGRLWITPMQINDNAIFEVV